MCISSSEANTTDAYADELFMDGDADADNTAKITSADPINNQNGVTKDTEAQRVAEAWRAGTSGRFERDEVNLTKIGAHLYSCSCL